MVKIFAVGLGGFFGATLRYFISSSSIKYFGDSFPYGTLIVNILGGVLIGFIISVSMDNPSISSNAKLFLTTGLLGGLTTFSTFSYESFNMFSNLKYVMGSINIFLNIFLSLTGVFLGNLFSKFI